MTSNVMPGRLEFHTRSDTSSGSLQERLRIDKNGHVSIISGNLEFANGAGIDFSNVPDSGNTLKSDGNK